MRDRTTLASAAFICAAVVSPLIFGEDNGLRSGAIIKDELFVGQGQARVRIPLPSGEWQVFRAEEQEMRMLNPAYQHMAPTRLEIFLMQRIGSRVAMTMRIEASKDVTPNSITSLSYDNPCKRTDTLYRNPYDSGGTVVNCLLVNHIVRYIRAARTGVFADLRSWMTKEGIEIPNTVLQATFAQNLTNRFLTVTVQVNPAMRDLDSTETVWLSSPFHRDLISRDVSRDRYAKEYIAWAEAYKPLIPISQPSQGGAGLANGNNPVPAFR
jgi:hypothetical protein